MKRFLKTISWWKNPKGGAFFGVLLVVGVALAMATLMPMALRAMSLVLSHGISRVRAEYDFIGVELHPKILWACALVLAYAVFLHVLYSIRLCRFSFNASKVKSAIFGVLFSAVMVPVCAVKQRNWIACALMVAASIVTTVVMFIMRIGAEPTSPLTQELLSLAALAMALSAMFRVKFEKDVSRLLAFSPALLVVVSLLGLHVCTWRQSRQIEAETAKLFKLAGIEVTFDDMVAVYTNGVPRTDEPYATLFSKKNALPSIPSRINRRNADVPPWVASDEATEEFDAFCVTNAATIALLDEQTLRRDSRPAGAYEKPSDISFFMDFDRWNNFYGRRIAHARGDGAASQIMEDAQRMSNIIHWQESQPTLLIPSMILSNMRTMRIRRLEFALASLPNDFLLALRAECRESRIEPETHYATMIAHETVSGNWEMEELRKQANGLPNMHSDIKRDSFGNRPLSRFNVAWFQREQIANLRDARTIIERLNAPLSDGETRFACVSKLVANGTPSFRVPLNATILQSRVSACAQIFGDLEEQMLFDAAIAVELYRRRYGALPESLDALVPEFLDATPVSVFDNAAFTYEHGLVETLQPAFLSSQKDRIYSFNGFKISGSKYKHGSDDKRVRRKFAEAPLGE